MRKWWAVIVLVILGAVSSPSVVSGQDGISKKKQEKIQAKKAKHEKKEKAKQERYDRRRHLSLQDKATRKRLRRHTKRADRRGSGAHRDGFFRRTFGW
jgi:Flp pilus assembly protein TadB